VNREQKRQMKRQGQGPEASTAARRDVARESAQRRQREKRPGARQYFREVRDEMRQVAWPTRAETANYTSIVGTVLLLMIVLIFVLNLGFSHAILWLFQK
jgi:preprotein translocase subunit SecE